MKRFLLFILTLSMGFAAFSQKVVKTSISGTIPELVGSKLSITFLSKPIAEVEVSEKGTFSYSTTQLKPGFYYTSYNYFIYLEPGMNLQIDKAKKGFNLQGKGSVENNLLADIQNLQLKMLFVRMYVLTDSANFIEPDVYLEKISQYKKTVADLVDKAPVSKDFASILKATADYDSKYFISQYKLQYGTDPAKKDSAMKFLTAAMKNKKPTESITMEEMNRYSELSRQSKVKSLSIEQSDKLEVLENFDINDGKMYASSISYRKLLDNRLRQLISAETTISPSLRRKNPIELKIYVINKVISDPVIKEHLIYENTLTMLRPGKSAEMAYQNYLSIAKDPQYISLIKKHFKNLQQLAPGNVSPKFEYASVDGKLVSSESLKGNYLYIDLWATWCAPCIAEIPALKELQQAYEGKNIKFLSISTDRKADLEKWKTFVKEKELTGTQLIINKESDFYKFYDIATIPRFVLLDKEGKIIDANAKRPSNPLLKKELDKLLN